MIPAPEEILLIDIFQIYVSESLPPEIAKKNKFLLKNVYRFFIISKIQIHIFFLFINVNLGKNAFTWQDL